MDSFLEGEEWAFPVNSLALYWRDSGKLVAPKIAELVTAKARTKPATEEAILALKACPVALRVATLKGDDGAGLFLVAAVGDCVKLNETLARPASSWMVRPVPVVRRNEAFLFFAASTGDDDIVESVQTIIEDCSPTSQRI